MDSAATEPEYLTDEELEELERGLTMLDVYRARKNKDRTEVGLRGYHEGAKRLGIVGSESTLEEFLGRIRANDFNRVMGGAGRDGLPNSPRSESGGADSQDSSATTATDLETSSSSPQTNTRD